MNHSDPCLAVSSQLGAPTEPRFVMIEITPLAASVPYSVAAAGPSMISIFWTSDRS